MSNMSRKWLFLVLCIVIIGCSPGNQSNNIKKSPPALNTITSTQEQPTAVNNTFSPEEELKWLDFCSMVVHCYPDFSLGDPMDDQAIIACSFKYVFETWSDKELDLMLVDDNFPYGLKEEAIEMSAQELFDREHITHQSANLGNGINLDYKNGLYYFDGFSTDYHDLIGIKRITDNGDGTYTLEFDCYGLTDFDLMTLDSKINTPEKFIQNIHDDPQLYPPPDESVKLMIKKVASEQKERYVVLQKTTLTRANDTVYIALNSAFMGTFEDDTWNSNHELKHNSNCNQIKENNAVLSGRKLRIEELNLGKPFYLYNVTEKLGKTTDYQCRCRMTVEYPMYQTNYEFTINGQSLREVPLGISGDFNPLPAKIIPYDVVEDRHRRAVKEILNKFGFTETQINISQVTSVDIDKDGRMEDIIIAQTPRKDDGWPDIRPENRFKDGTGVYITALAIKNGQAIPLFFQGHKLKEMTYREEISFGIDSCLGLKLLGVFDLNHDGCYEVCLANYGWESAQYRVYEWQGNNTMKEVLYGDYGM